ncbi:hypothetical protein COCVIDRAFT_37169 [Bipolaris victoriae FI3]|uniref:AA1-like domain-containing protein n=2 Tax=Bipolaris TaxID=33194 RepID=W6YS91_COCC2|nr:uncharacterized protein COCCADRAFT_83732 [Bipolaris zeicola 26-R-13]XP_014557283.1 hypothetical protein COCVIDRAFT_37169 [Bipolaris victoriae FI3]EUC38264.1 hypothetical protein COCCADRAFT_83732 [Bipolaris zeicola 26-R-13]
MQFTTITSLLFAASGLTSAASLRPRQDACEYHTAGDYTWRVSQFVGRKPEATYYNMISFHIASTNPGSSFEWTCSASADRMEDSVFYSCGDGFQFAFVNEYNGLIFKYGTDNPIMGTVSLPIVCRAGGAGANDQVCETFQDRCITLLEHPSN